MKFVIVTRTHGDMQSLYWGKPYNICLKKNYNEHWKACIGFMLDHFIHLMPFWREICMHRNWNSNLCVKPKIEYTKNVYILWSSSLVINYYYSRKVADTPIIKSPSWKKNNGYWNQIPEFACRIQTN